jgi:hypothetical protein
MKWYEYLRQQYRSHRYLDHLTEEELRQRAKDIFCNSLTLTNEGKIGLHPPKREGEYWMLLWTHVLEEFVLRYGPYPAGFTNGFIKKAQIPKPTWPEIPKAVDAIKDLNLRYGKYSVRYDKYHHLLTAIERGLIRIAPASSYDDPSLNPATRDTELEKSISIHPSEINIELLDRITGRLKAPLRPLGNVTYTLRSPTDYYVYCLSCAYLPRLFDDFEADSCLIILQPKRFIEAVLESFPKKMGGWAGIGSSVSYYDPTTARAKKLSPWFSKHFRYSYQREYRIVWLPPRPKKKLAPIYLELGSLRSYGRLIHF